MAKGRLDKELQPAPPDPQALRRHFCAAFELKVSRYRRPAGAFLRLRSQLRSILAIYSDASATEDDLKGTINGLYEIRRDVNLLAEEAAQDSGPTKSTQYEAYIVAIEQLIQTFIHGRWPLKPCSETDGPQAEMANLFDSIFQGENPLRAPELPLPPLKKSEYFQEDMMASLPEPQERGAAQGITESEEVARPLPEDVSEDTRRLDHHEAEANQCIVMPVPPAQSKESHAPPHAACPVGEPPFKTPAKKPDLLAKAMVEQGNHLFHRLGRAPSSTELWDEVRRLASELDLEVIKHNERETFRFETSKGPSKWINATMFAKRYQKYIKCSHR
jgi:hypothetical protein